MDKVEAILLNYIRVCEKQDLLERILSRGMFGEYGLSEVHCIDLIGRIAEANVTKLSEGLHMTRGAISKIAKKMLERGNIVSYQKPGNKKEIYFQLTEQGKTLYVRHELEHRKQEARYKAFFSQLSDEERNTVISVLEGLHSYLEEQIKELNFRDN